MGAKDTKLMYHWDFFPACPTTVAGTPAESRPGSGGSRALREAVGNTDLRWHPSGRIGSPGQTIQLILRCVHACALQIVKPYERAG